jgi:hypothetical protein
MEVAMVALLFIASERNLLPKFEGFALTQVNSPAPAAHQRRLHGHPRAVGID